MGKIKWYEHVVFKEEIKIEKEDIWTRFKDDSKSYYQELMMEENSIVMM